MIRPSDLQGREAAPAIHRLTGDERRVLIRALAAAALRAALQAQDDQPGPDASTQPEAA